MPRSEWTRLQVDQLIPWRISVVVVSPELHWACHFGDVGDNLIKRSEGDQARL
jgi:hypothetical protein